jgi:hypothetical protein
MPLRDRDNPEKVTHAKPVSGVLRQNNICKPFQRWLSPFACGIVIIFVENGWDGG